MLNIYAGSTLLRAPLLGLANYLLFLERVFSTTRQHAVSRITYSPLSYQWLFHFFGISSLEKQTSFFWAVLYRLKNPWSVTYNAALQFRTLEV